MDSVVFDISLDPYPDDVVLSDPIRLVFLAPGDTTFAALELVMELTGWFILGSPHMVISIQTL